MMFWADVFGQVSVLGLVREEFGSPQCPVEDEDLQRAATPGTVWAIAVVQLWTKRESLKIFSGRVIRTHLHYELWKK